MAYRGRDKGYRTPPKPPAPKATPRWTGGTIGNYVQPPNPYMAGTLGNYGANARAPITRPIGQPLAAPIAQPISPTPGRVSRYPKPTWGRS